jgi:hypothetical protein
VQWRTTSPISAAPGHIGSTQPRRDAYALFQQERAQDHETESRIDQSDAHQDQQNPASRP